ncbi:MAG: dihydroneopterin aldolase [Lentisphaeria bacterium]
MDKIRIHSLLVRCIIGAFPKERDHKQDVVFDITLGTDITPAAESDELADAVDYKALRDKIVTFTESSSFKLLESLAENIAALCLKESGVQTVRVCVRKPGALTFARDVSVEITRG